MMHPRSWNSIWKAIGHLQDQFSWNDLKTFFYLNLVLRLLFLVSVSSISFVSSGSVLPSVVSVSSLHISLLAFTTTSASSLEILFKCSAFYFAELWTYCACFFFLLLFLGSATSLHFSSSADDFATTSLLVVNSHSFPWILSWTFPSRFSFCSTSCSSFFFNFFFRGGGVGWEDSSFSGDGVKFSEMAFTGIVFSEIGGIASSGTDGIASSGIVCTSSCSAAWQSKQDWMANLIRIVTIICIGADVLSTCAVTLFVHSGSWGNGDWLEDTGHCLCSCLCCRWLLGRRVFTVKQDQECNMHFNTTYLLV